MAKFTKLNIGAVVASYDGRVLKKLSTNSSGGGGAPRITFTIEGATYYAEEYMTWEEWVNSGYSTDGFVINNGQPATNSGYPLITTDEVPQYANSVIVDGKNYAINWYA